MYVYKWKVYKMKEKWSCLGEQRHGEGWAKEEWEVWIRSAHSIHLYDWFLALKIKKKWQDRQDQHSIWI